jgi:tRNA-Thr(GGU) m(6)t(6)A37 methyltransferase TsaA
MVDSDICFEPIGVIRSGFTSVDEPPKQAAFADSATGRIELEEEYVAGLSDIDGFSHVILIYHLHQVGENVPLLLKPFAEDTERGVFATRAPRRPNPIGMSVVQLNSVEESVLTVGGIDVIDGTPLLDIKPFVPTVDTGEDYTIGWLEGGLEARKE